MQCKNIVIWGAGKYGTFMRDNIIQNYPEYKIVGIADSKFFYEDLADDDYPHLVFDDVRRLHQKGSLYGVIVAIVDVDACHRVSVHLKGAGIRVINLYENVSIIDEADVAKQSYRLPIHYGGATVHIVNDIYGVPQVFNHSMSFFQEENRMLHSSVENFMADGAYEYNVLLPLRKKGKQVIEIDCAAPFCQTWTAGNLWHFTFQHISRIFQMEMAGFKGKYLMLDTPVARQSMALTGIEPHRLVWVDESKKDVLYYIKEFYYTRFVIGQYNVSVAESLNGWVNFVIEHNQLDEKITNYPKRIFVKRITSRKLLRAEKILNKYGFFTMIPEEHSLIEQIKFFRAADVVVCPHGANSTNCIYMRSGATFIETFGREYFSPHCVYVLKRRKIRYRMLLEKLNSDIFSNAMDMYRDYTIEDGLLEGAIEEALEGFSYGKN